MRCEAQRARDFGYSGAVSQSLRAHSQTRKLWGRECISFPFIFYSANKEPLQAGKFCTVSSRMFFFLFVTLHTLSESSVFVSLSHHPPLSPSFAVDVFLVC